MSKDPLSQSIQQHASQCVKCGLCLPHCPTYALTENECESPRGRIALFDALAKQQIPLTAKTELYLDHCLSCRACEAVCPAKVNYGTLMDQGRELIATQNPAKKSISGYLDFYLRHPRLWRPLAFLLMLYQRSALQYLIRKSRLLKLSKLQRAEALLPAQIRNYPFKNFYAAQGKAQGQVAIFAGCMDQLVDQITIKAAIKILNASGYNVILPKQSNCCGALYLHAGAKARAQTLAAQNIALFNQFQIDKIITLSSGCSATLQEYATQLATTAAAEFTQKIIDINHFLIDQPSLKTLAFKPLRARAVVHIPCTLRNVLKRSAAPAQLLQYIPALEIINLAQESACCGAAGQYLLQHPTMADALQDKLLNAIIPLKPEYLMTANIGCALQLQKGLRENQLSTQLLHPVVLLAKQLIPAH